MWKTRTASVFLSHGARAEARAQTTSVVERFAEKIERLFWIGFLEGLAFLLQFVVKAEDGVLHAFVRFGRTAQEEKVFAACQPLMAVLIIETDADEAENLFLVVAVVSVRHGILHLHDVAGNELTPL